MNRVFSTLCLLLSSLTRYIRASSLIPLFYYSSQSSPPAVFLVSTLPLMHEHLSLNFGTSAPSQSGTANLPSPPQTQHQQASPSCAPPPATAPPGATALGCSGPPPASSSSSHTSPSSGITAATSSSVLNSAQHPPPASRAAPVPDAQIVAQQAAKLAALRTRLSQLKAARPIAPQAMAAPLPSLVPPVLFANLEVIDRARDAALAAKDGDKKLLLPEIIPGFKANSLNIHKWLHFPHPPPFFWSRAPSAKGHSVYHSSSSRLPPPFVICLLKVVFVSSILLELCN